MSLLCIALFLLFFVSLFLCCWLFVWLLFVVWLFGLGWVVHRHLVSSHSLAIAACRDLICVIVGMSLVLPWSSLSISCLLG
jgi:hypothetical protein